jgi:DNA replication and repair protein RecF
VWNEQLVEMGTKIIQTRIYFLKRLHTIAKNIHRGITNQGEELELIYQSTVLSSQADTKKIQECFRKKLESRQGMDIQKGSTSVGPHRDDIKIKINGKDIRIFGSQGQQRTTALSLKLSVLELIHSEIGEYPILLLDDVMSELDGSRQEKLIQALGEVQTFITSTDLNFLRNLEGLPMYIYRIQGGQISRYNR